MISEIFVEGKRLDAGTLSSLLTFELDDIRDFSSRSTTWSKTVVVPGTAHNNAIFGNIFETGLTNDYDPTQANVGYNFNASKSAKCIIFQDNLQTFKGTLRLLQINKDKKHIEYEVALNGELTSLSVALTSGLLTDLDFSAYNLPYTSTNISSSWFNTPGSGVTFPHIDYGTYSTPSNVPRPKRDWQFGTFRPALYVREYIDKMITAANFRYAAPLFDTDRFKKLIVPHNQKDVLSPKTGLLFTAATNVEENVLHWTNGTVDGDVHFLSFLGGSFSSSDNKTFTYTGASPVTGKLTFTITGRYHYDIDVLASAKLYILKDSTIIYSTPDILPYVSSTNTPFSKSHTIDISFNNGETFSVHLQGKAGIGLVAKDIWVNGGLVQFSTPATVLAPVEYGETIQINYCIPKNIRQIDFLVSVVKLFNLYVYEDRYDERLIHIRPFPQFYDQGADSVVDWSNKMNRGPVITVKPMSELNTKLYEFNFAKDSDYFNDLYQKRYNQVYGSYTFDTEFEYSSNTTKVEVIFAPTPLVGYQNEIKVYSTILKLSGTTEDRTDSVIRIMQSRPITGVPTWQIFNGATVLGTYDHYGYAGHYDNPDNPSDDLNFGGLQEVFFQLVTATSLDKTQFNLFWSLYMAEITDKDSKLLSARFYLTAEDIFNLRFSRFVAVDGVLYRLNKITDYNASNPDDCGVELLRVINTNYRYPLGNTADSDNALLWNDTGAMMANDNDEIIWE